MPARAVFFVLVVGAMLLTATAITNRFSQGVSFQAATDELGQTSRVQIGSVSYTVELARTPQEQALGLSGRASLAKDRGMLFVLDEPGQPSFWMKDMRFPIDIVWIRDSVIVDISANLPTPITGTKPEDLPTYQPKAAVDLVLEINAGQSKQFKIGDSVVVARTTGV